VEEPSHWNCSACGDRLETGEDNHKCWVLQKYSTQESFSESKDTPDTTGSEDIIARMKLPAQYPVYC
jgi:hypothetical protein